MSALLARAVEAARRAKACGAHGIGFPECDHGRVREALDRSTAATCTACCENIVRAVADVLFGECSDRVAAHWPDHPAYSSSGFGYKRTGANALLAAQRRELGEDLP